jgi:hypothetical protein
VNPPHAILSFRRASESFAPCLVTGLLVFRVFPVFRFGMTLLPTMNVQHRQFASKITAPNQHFAL